MIYFGAANIWAPCFRMIIIKKSCIFFLHSDISLLDTSLLEYFIHISAWNVSLIHPQCLSGLLLLAGFMVWGLLSIEDGTRGCSFDVFAPWFLVVVSYLIFCLSVILVVFNTGISIWVCFIQFGRKLANNTL